MEDTIANSQPTQISENSVLSQRDPNSQPKHYSLPTPSQETTGCPAAGAKESSSTQSFVKTSDLPDTLDSRRPPPAPSLSTMSQTPQAQIGLSSRGSPGIVASARSGGPSLKERLVAMRANSRAEAAVRRTTGKEQGRSQSPILANDSAVQANRLNSPNLRQPHTSDLRPPEASVPGQTSASEDQVSMTEPPSLDQLRVSQEAVTDTTNLDTDQKDKSPPPALNSLSDQTFPGKPAPVTQMESRIETRSLEVAAEVPLPLRVSQSVAHTPTYPSKLSFHEEMASVSQVTASLVPVDLGKMEYALALGMNARVRDQYLAVLNSNGSRIESLERCLPHEISVSLVDQINEMIARLDRISTHCDLDDPSTANQQDTTVQELTAWAEHNSEKFKFLSNLLGRLRDRQIHVAIIARPGRTLDIVESFLKGVRVAYNRPDTYVKSKHKTTGGRIEVSLISSGKEGSSALPRAADLVIALDGSFDARDNQAVTLRSHLTNVGQLAPVLHLLVYKSAEHIERCVSRSLDPIDRVRRIVSCLTQIGDAVGLLPPDQLLPPIAAAEEVAIFIKEGGHEHLWDTLPRLTPIDGIISLEYSNDPASAESERRPRAVQRVVASSGALKRALVF